MNEENSKEKEDVLNTEEENSKENALNAEDNTKEEVSNVNENTKNEEPKNKKSIVNSLATVGGLIVWLLVFIILALLIFTVLSRKTDVLGYRLYIIMSGSMEPTIQVKDLIVTKTVDEAKEGDIIAFENGNIVTVHRVIKVYTEGNTRLYETKGDSNNVKDQGLVQQSQVKGKVAFKLPFLGKAMIFMQTHFVAFMVVVGILIFIILIRRLI